MDKRILLFIIILSMFSNALIDNTGINVNFFEDQDQRDGFINGSGDFMGAYNTSSIEQYYLEVLDLNNNQILNLTIDNASNFVSSVMFHLEFQSNAKNFSLQIIAKNSTDSSHPVLFNFTDFVNVSNSQANNSQNNTQSSITWEYEDAHSCFQQMSESSCKTHTTTASGSDHACEWEFNGTTNICEPEEKECYTQNQTMCSQLDYCGYESPYGCFELEWQFKDSASCLPINNQTSCEAHSTSLSGNNSACAWFSDVNECEPKEIECNTINDQNQCSSLDYCNWDSNSCHNLDNMNYTQNNQSYHNNTNQSNHNNTYQGNQTGNYSNQVTCYDHNQTSCNADSSCSWDGYSCQQSLGNLTCDQLDSSSCSNYGNACNYDYTNNACEFNCMSLNEHSCNSNNQCAWDGYSCQTGLGNLTCADLNENTCYNYGSLCSWDWLTNVCYTYDPNAAYCSVDTSFIDPYSQQQTDIEIDDNKDLVLTINVPVPNTTGCEDYFDLNYEKPSINLWSVPQPFIPDDSCHHFHIEFDEMYSDADSCFEIKDESSCLSHTTTLSGSDNACEWFYDFNGVGLCEPRINECYNQNDQTSCTALDYCEWKSNSCSEIPEHELKPDGCSPEAEYNCNMWSQATLSDDNSTYIFNVSGLSDGTYEINIEAPWACKKKWATISLNYNLETSTTLNKTFGIPVVVSGVAMYENGSVIANAHINAWSKTGGGGYAWADADENGTFELYGLSSGDFQLEISTPNWDKWYKTIFSLEGSDLNLGNVVFGAGPGLKGYVLSDSNPQPYTWVSLRSKIEGIDPHSPNYWSQIEYYGSETNSNGYFDISGMEAGNYVIEVWPNFDSGLLPFEAEVTIGTDKTDYNISLEGGKSISGYVLDSSSNPLNGVSVNAFVEIDWSKIDYNDCEYCGPGYYGWAMTDQNGHYELFGLKEAKYVVEAYPDEWFNPSLKGYTSSREEVRLQNSVNKNFTLVRGLSLYGTVTDGSNPITCGWVNAWIPSEDRFSGPNSWAWSDLDQNGNYNMTGLLPNNKYQMFVEPCFETGLSGKNSNQFMNLSDVQKDFVLSSGGKLIGSVKDSSGNGVGGASISTWLENGQGWGFAISDPNGDFKIKGLNPTSSTKKYNLEIWHNDYTFQNINGVDVADNQETDLGDITLSSGHKLNGTVTYSNGTAISEAFVDIWCETGAGWGSTQTSATGAYSIEGLPSCEYNMNIYVPSTYESKFQKGVSVNSDTNYDVLFEIKTLVTASGTVTDGSSPVSGAFVDLYSQSSYVGGSTTTDASGNFNRSNLPQGTDYSIYVEKDGYYANFTQNVNIANAVNVNLDAVSQSQTFNITGSVLNVNSPVVVIAVNKENKLINQRTTTNSTYTISGLVNGNYDVFAVYGTTKSQYPDTVTSSASSGINFDFE